MSGKKKHRSRNGKQPAATRKHVSQQPTPKKKPSAPAKGGANRRSLYIVTALIAIAAIVAVVVAAGGSKGGPGSAVAASPEEAKYIGRFLPAGYEEPKVADEAAAVAAKMTPVTAKTDAAGVTIPVADVVSSKIVSFQYQKNSGEAVPLLAYVKPSGKLFVGVSYCVPCRGTGQRVEADGTLTCEACGTKRDLESSVGLSGPCKLYPLDELPVTVNNGQIQVPTSALEAWTVQPLDRKVG